MSSIIVTDLVKAFGTMRAIDGVSFRVDPGEILVIVGASGCGKTTTLRCIAGLEQPTSGTIEIDGRIVVSDKLFVPPEQRGVGMMFQSYALWPHKSVFDNVAYGLALRRLPKAEIRDKVNQALATVGLGHLADRFPSTLSGGQQQRVALARSAVVEPSVLLLDEPLSNLDAKLRERMRIELRQLVKSLKMTAIHITHDQTEAMAIADKVIYMRGGKTEQEGTPRELYRQPKSRWVAEFVGSATFLDATVIGKGTDGRTQVQIGSGLVLETTSPASRELTELTVALRPEALQLAVSPLAGPNSFPVTVTEEIYLGDSTEYTVDMSGAAVRCRSREDFPVGARLYLSSDPGDVICLPRE